MNAPVVVPLDGSGFAEAALQMARLLASLTGGEIHLVHVTPTATADAFHPDERLTVEAHMRNGSAYYLEARAREMSARDGPVARTAVLDDGGGVAHAVAEYAESVEAGWIVLTTHGAGGFKRLLAGSVAQELAKVASTRLLLVRSWDTTVSLGPGERRIRRILIAVDGTPESESALGPARELAQAFGAWAVLVRVIPPRADRKSVV